ncbi:RHS repeat-associated core domain-containing protein [Tateyamaria sp. syn59]|uniref:RHS repeat-associated core domain-containing protein n=1 Tax=Tateyamaria sp. syn59 TaxID=2576942 RepID=UPI0011BEF215|nr:RHS repeat-associated core domain-containing protein [Tateyamaria sp. syn59]
MQDFDPSQSQDVTSSSDGTDTSGYDANANGRTAVGAGGPEMLADWITAFDDYQQRWEDEKEALEDEIEAMEAELAAETDPLMRQMIEADLAEARIDLSVIDAEFGGAFNPYESGTGQWEIRDFNQWAEQMQMDPTNPDHAAIFNQQMETYTEFNEQLIERVEDDHWFFYNILNPLDRILQWDPRGILMRRATREIAERGLRAGLRNAPRALSRGRRTARVNGRRNRTRDRRNCRRASNPFMLPTGVGNHEDPFFVIPGLIELSLHSIYWSDIDHVSPHGTNRMAPYDAVIKRNLRGGFDLLDDDGYVVSFPAPTPIPEGWVDGSTTRPLKLMQGKARALILRDGLLFHHFDKGADGIWRISRIYNANDNTLDFKRGPDGQLYRITTPEGLTVVFGYDGALRTSAELVAPDGQSKRVLEWRYDEHGNMLEARAIYGEHHRFRYDERNRIIGLQRNEVYDATYTLDDQGRRLGSDTSGPYHGDRVAYDSDARKTVYLPGGDQARAQTYHYNDNDNITAEENALGHLTRFEEDAEGLVSATIDPLGHRTRFLYDADGNVKSTRDPLDRITYYGWSADGQIDRVIDPSGATWEYEYDERGNLVSVRDPLGHITDLKVSDRGLVVGECRHDGMIRTYSYDDRHRLISEVDFNGAETTFIRDTWGRITSTTDELGATIRFEYEDQPGLDFWTAARVIRADGARTELRGQAHGRIVEMSDAEGAVTRLVHDAFDNLIEMVDPRGGSLRFTYDDQLALSEVTNQAGEVWHFERDAAGRIIREVDFAGLELRHDFDDADRPIALHFPDGRTMRFEWDAADQLIARIGVAPDGTVQVEDRFDYDSRGLITRATGADAVIELEYDAVGNQIAEVQNGQRIERAFDCCGNVTERRIGTHLTEYSYGPSGFLTGLCLNGTDTLTIDRDPLGRPIAMRGAGAFELLQEFDSAGQLIRQLAYGPDGFTRSYAWDRRDTPTHITDDLWGATEYQSDANAQITQARHGVPAGSGMRLATPVPSDVPGFPSETIEVERFTYKRTQDVEAADIAQPQMPLDQPLSYWRTAPGGRVHEATGLGGERITLSYDTCGRVTERRVQRDGFRPQTWTYHWDVMDRLVACITPEGERWDYTYDPFGRRIEKRSASTRTQFLWDGDVIAIEATDGIAAVHWHFEPRSHRPLLRDGETLGHVITDHLGTPREIVDGSGAILWSATYRLWGKERGQWGDPTLCPIRFPGQWHDAESGLHYNRFRYYDPNVGQYLSIDPLGASAGTRAHGYVSNPLHWIDPLGLQRNFPASMPPRAGFERHHIIPFHLRTRPLLRSVGFDIDSQLNLMYLPRTCASVSGGGALAPRTAAQHRGFNGHSAYNAYMDAQLRQLDQRTSNMSTTCKRLAVRSFVLAHRTMLQTGAIQIANCR